MLIQSVETPNPFGDGLDRLLVHPTSSTVVVGFSSGYLIPDPAAHGFRPFISQIIHAVTENIKETAAVYVQRRHCHSWASFNNGNIVLSLSYIVFLVPGRQLGKSTIAHSSL